MLGHNSMFNEIDVCGARAHNDVLALSSYLQSGHVWPLGTTLDTTVHAYCAVSLSDLPRVTTLIREPILSIMQHPVHPPGWLLPAWYPLHKVVALPASTHLAMPTAPQMHPVHHPALHHMVHHHHHPLQPNPVAPLAVLRGFVANGALRQQPTKVRPISRNDVASQFNPPSQRLLYSIKSKK